MTIKTSVIAWKIWKIFKYDGDAEKMMAE